MSKLSYFQYKERFNEMYRGCTAPPPQHCLNQPNLTTRKVGVLLRELSDDEDDTAMNATSNPSDPWRRDFDSYLNSRDQLGTMSIVEWWGVSSTRKLCSKYTDLMTALQWNAIRYPVWASLARDYLPIMGSSVSSERAFSSAGITISKRRSRLKPDIVEALQFMKCAYRRELLFREEPSTASEMEQEFPDSSVSEGQGDVDEQGWDALVGDLCNDEEFCDLDSDEVYVQTVV